MDQTLDMQNQYCERRHQPCEDVTKLGGQVNILKWIFGITVSIILIIGAGLWARTDSLKDEMTKNSKELTERIVINNKELTRAMKDLSVKLEQNNGDNKVIQIQLDVLSAKLDDIASIGAYTQNLVKEKR